MTLTTKAVIGTVAAAAIGGTTYMLMGVTPTPVTWPCKDCPPGDARVCMYALASIEPAGVVDKHETCIDTKFPQPDDQLVMEFVDLDKQAHTVYAKVDYVNALTPDQNSSNLVVMGLGSDAPSPTPEPTTTPTPTSTPSPTPTSTPTPTDCTQVQGGTADIGTLSIQSGWTWLVTPDGVGGYFSPGGSGLPAAAVEHFVFVGGVAYGYDGRPEYARYYKLTGRGQVVAETPVCGTPTPTPTTTPSPTPTSTPSPTPTPTTTPMPPQAGYPAPTYTNRSCVLETLTAVKPVPATGSGWKVQYFNGNTAITTASTTVTRTGVTVPAGSLQLKAVWTKSGQPSYTTDVTARECGVK